MTRFNSMTKPDDFYASAMKTLAKLDEVLPAGSSVVALALFDGELLYGAMHKEQVYHLSTVVCILRPVS
jgi:hypothetical protein